MKRHESLVQFSRFHRSCLFLALIAKKNAPDVKGYPIEVSGKITYAINFYESQLKLHFQKEERLWAFVKNKSEVLLEIIQSLEKERTQLIHIFEILKSEPLAAILFEMGDLLEKHVRKEERVLFQQIQQDLTEEELVELSKLFSTH